MRFSYVSRTILALVLQVTGSRNVRASEVCNHWLAGPLHNQSEGINAIGNIFASAVWSPATGGSFLVVGGEFTTIGGMPVSHIAMWDGASWRTLGTGVNGMVEALAVYNGDLIVAGRFTQAGGAPANRIARFDGTAWHPLAEGFVATAEAVFPIECSALAVFEGDLIAGGSFDHSGNIQLINIARWNGLVWSTISPLQTNVGQIGIGDSVRAMRVHNNALYIGGRFQSAGGISANNVVRFLSGSFAALGNGTSGGIVSVLQSFGADLIVGGAFTTAGGLSVGRVARWTPGAGSSGTWSTMSSGPGGGTSDVRALQPFNGQLIAGGFFPGAVSAWNGASWAGVGGGMAGGFSISRVDALNVFNGQLNAGGNFATAGGVPASSIAQWSGSFWSALQAPTPQVLAIDTLGSRLVAAGSFLQSTTSQTPAHNIIGWNGTTLTQVKNNTCCGEGTNGTIRALKGFTAIGTPHLIVGGDFTVAGGLAANRIAQYDQPQLAGAAWIALGAGFNNSVYAIERFNNATYAGGTFTQSGATVVNRIARFDGTNWVALGSGLNGVVNAMKVYNGFLYVGGAFTTAGGVTTGSLARWDGTAWSKYNGVNTLSGTVYALEIHNNDLIVSGDLAPQHNVLRFNGQLMFVMVDATTNPNGPVTALKSDGQHVYATGGFTTIGSLNANHVARWNIGTGWSDVEGGTNDVVNTLGLFHGEIQVGLGNPIAFNGPEAAAPQPGKGWVRYSPTGITWIASNPISQTVSCSSLATFTAQPSQGYSLLLATWNKNGVALNDGDTGHGSTIFGAHASTLTITGVKTFDAGSYTCTFANICGTATSSAATLTVNNCCDPDITGNRGEVNIDDLVAVIGQWGPCPAPPGVCTADIAPTGGNGIVDIDDMIAVINGWGACP